MAASIFSERMFVRVIPYYISSSFVIFLLFYIIFISSYRFPSSFTYIFSLFAFFLHFLFSFRHFSPSLLLYLPSLCLSPFSSSLSSFVVLHYFLSLFPTSNPSFTFLLFFPSSCLFPPSSFIFRLYSFHLFPPLIRPSSSFIISFRLFHFHRLPLFFFSIPLFVCFSLHPLPYASSSFPLVKSSPPLYSLIFLVYSFHLLPSCLRPLLSPSFCLPSPHHSSFAMSHHHNVTSEPALTIT